MRVRHRVYLVEQSAGSVLSAGPLRLTNPRVVGWLRLTRTAHKCLLACGTPESANRGHATGIRTADRIEIPPRCGRHSRSTFFISVLRVFFRCIAFDCRWPFSESILRCEWDVNFNVHNKERCRWKKSQQRPRPKRRNPNRHRDVTCERSHAHTLSHTPSRR